LDSRKGTPRKEDTRKLLCATRKHSQCHYVQEPYQTSIKTHQHHRSKRRCITPLLKLLECFNFFHLLTRLNWTFPPNWFAISVAKHIMVQCLQNIYSCASISASLSYVQVWERQQQEWNQEPESWSSCAQVKAMSRPLSQFQFLLLTQLLTSKGSWSGPCNPWLIGTSAVRHLPKTTSTMSCLRTVLNPLQILLSKLLWARPQQSLRKWNKRKTAIERQASALLAMVVLFPSQNFWAGVPVLTLQFKAPKFSQALLIML